MDDFHVPSLQIHKFIRTPYFLRTPGNYVAEINTLYQEMKTDVPRLRQYLSEQAGSPKTLHSHKFRVASGVLLTVAAGLNHILRTIEPNNPVLLRESQMLIAGVIQLARESSQYRPMGGSFIPPCLTAAVCIPRNRSCSEK